MDPRIPSEQSSHPYGSTQDCSNTEQGCSELAYQPQANFHPDNFPNDETYLRPPYQYSPWHGTEYLPNQQSVPSTPNDASKFHPQPPFSSNDPSHGYGQFLDPDCHLNDDHTHNVAPSMQAHRAAGFGRINSHIIQQGLVNQWVAQGASGPSDPSRSSFMTTPDTPGSLSDEWNSQSGAQDDYLLATLSSHGQVEGDPQSQAVTQGQDATTQGSQRRGQRSQKKREKDKVRKRGYRSRNEEEYAKICDLLGIELDPINSEVPNNTLAHRIRVRVEALVEREKIVGNFLDQFDESEDVMAALGRNLAINANTAPSGLDTGATWQPRS